MIFPSLRTRLIVIILVPLTLIASLAALWQFSSETKRAEIIFDRGLLSAALAISRDVALSDGDALSTNTRRLVNNTSGGEVFYHVFAPDGVFVTGYSTPPVPPTPTPAQSAEPYFYEAEYQGKDVRVLRIQYITTVADVSGVYNVTVWQSADVRSSFVRDVVMRSVAVTVVLVMSLFLVVWFGVGLGLRPLLDLQDAIAQRSPSELKPIVRDVPAEAKGLVSTLNSLLDRVSRRISSKDEFISNAAHQLRNPVAGVLALAEAVEQAPDARSVQKRSRELVEAARQASRLTNQLLSFERAAGSDMTRTSSIVDLGQLVTETVQQNQARASDQNVRLETEIEAENITIDGDPVMIREAILNLLNNALVHGGDKMDRITMRVTRQKDQAILVVEDNGVGIPSDRRFDATLRFGQLNNGPGSGLGLPIAARVASNHGGTLEILPRDDGTSVCLTFPVAPEADLIDKQHLP